MDDEAGLLERARRGDRAAFDALVAPHLPRLRSFLHRLVAHPDDADDLAHDTTLQAFHKLTSFGGEPAFSIWLFAIAHRLALTHLRTRKQRWPATIQLELLERTAASEPFGAELGGELDRPDFRYDVNEHIACCFSCIGRSLDPEDSAALLLRDVLDIPDHEAARIVDVPDSTFRHRVGAARRSMIDAFDGVCALVNRHGACQQCRTLRERCPSDRQGPPIEPLCDPGPERDGDDDAEAMFARRLERVRSADVVAGSTARMHAVMLRFIAHHAEPPAAPD
ncbi:MAG TPA: RNA polymerase sigma factor [Kofleriaceae bacterium]|nr:RNA polymerase sigma factor [Kofleriaceae bacterium]